MTVADKVTLSAGQRLLPSRETFVITRGKDPAPFTTANMPLKRTPCRLRRREKCVISSMARSFKTYWLSPNFSQQRKWRSSVICSRHGLSSPAEIQYNKAVVVPAQGPNKQRPGPDVVYGTKHTVKYVYV